MRFIGKAGARPGRKLAEEKLRLVGAILALTLTCASAAHAAELVVYNLSSRPVTCTVDGYTKASGADADVAFRVDPGQRLNIPPSFKSKAHAINTVDCAGF
jgi:hypothetical protein